MVMRLPAKQGPLTMRAALANPASPSSSSYSPKNYLPEFLQAPMVKAYNFIASWQLFPEKGNYENGVRPKSGLYRIEAGKEKKELVIDHSWTTIENEGFHSRYEVTADGDIHPFTQQE